ncbi:MAG: hypothetical protein E7085_03605 [Parabacteroides distasonis]|nr:hypothetical protein [Parabacteroides distasonis]
MKTSKQATIAVVLNILACAFYIGFLSFSIQDKNWGYALLALFLFVCHTVLVKEIRKKSKKE